MITDAEVLSLAMAAEAAPIFGASLDDDSRRTHCGCELRL
jgi:hypothetical protein